MSEDQIVERTPRGPGARQWTEGLLIAMVLCSFFSIALMQILLGLAFLNFLVGIRRAARGNETVDSPPVRFPLLWPMAAFMAISLFSALLVGEGHAVKEALSGGMPLVAFWIALNAFRGRSSLRRATYAVCLGGFLAAGYGMLEGFFAPEGVRIAGSLSHYYTFSGVVMVSAMMLAAGLVFGAGARERTLMAAGLVPILTALLLTQTRAALLAVAVGGAVLLVLGRPKALPVLPVLAVLMYLLAPTDVQARIRSSVDPQDETTNERLHMWAAGREMIESAPVLGIGPDMPHQRFREFSVDDGHFSKLPSPGHLHNNVIHLTAERGVLGLLAWLAFWLLWFYKSARIYFRIERQDSIARVAVAGSLAAMVGFQVMGVFEYNMGDSEVATLALAVMALPFAAESMLEASSDQEGGISLERAPSRVS